MKSENVVLCLSDFGKTFEIQTKETKKQNTLKTKVAWDTTFKEFSSFPSSYYPIKLNHIRKTTRVTVLLVGQVYKKQLPPFPLIKLLEAKSPEYGVQGLMTSEAEVL